MTDYDKMYKIVGVAMRLYNELGYGYSEPIYQECLSILCTEEGIPWEREKELTLFFHDQLLEKKYKADFVCYNNLIVELKAVNELTSEHRAQLFNYMRITHSYAGVLINFGNPRRLISEKYLFNPITNEYESVSSH